VARLEADVAVYQEEIEKLEGQISNKRQEKNTLQKDADSKADNPKPYLQTLNKKQVSDINKLLEKTSPKDLVQFLEKFVGMLRN